MARIRTIKPEYWSDDKLGPMDPLTRLVFLGLVSQADDAGRLVDSPKRINGLLFPFTDDDCTPCLELLSTVGVISRGLTASGQPVIQIVGWQRHQKIEKPNLRAALPPIVPPSKVRRRIPDESANDRGSLPDISPGEGEVEVEGISKGSGEGGDLPAREVASLDGFTPTAEHRALALELGLDVGKVATDWRLHRKANGSEPADLDADFERWIRREPGFRSTNGNGAHAESPAPSRTWAAPLKPAESEPDMTAEERAESTRIAASVKQSLRGDATAEPRLRREPMPPARIEDPKAIARIEEERAAQRLKLERLRGVKP